MDTNPIVLWYDNDGQLQRRFTLDEAVAAFWPYNLDRDYVLSRLNSGHDYYLDYRMLGWLSLENRHC